MTQCWIKRIRTVQGEGVRKQGSPQALPEKCHAGGFKTLPWEENAGLLRRYPSGEAQKNPIIVQTVAHLKQRGVGSTIQRKVPPIRLEKHSGGTTKTGLLLSPDRCFVGTGLRGLNARPGPGRGLKKRKEERIGPSCLGQKLGIDQP